MGLSDSERISTRRVTDGRTDEIGVAYRRYSMLSRVKMERKMRGGKRRGDSAESVLNL